MGAGWAKEIEAIADCGAAAILGAAAAFGASRAGAGPAAAAAAAGVCVLGAYVMLRGIVVREPAFALASFAPVDADFEECDELLLADADRLQTRGEELVLDDILAKLREGSRVVRLFDPAAMPSPVEFRDRIDGHAKGHRSSSEPQDASEALHAALSELRRSLR
ncbi:MAG TPA: hypothetical protein VJ597_07140 [Sphingomicrobium sp.]|nr:hypothetical protein [Sphingomicrobium sp.]